MSLAGNGEGMKERKDFVKVKAKPGGPQMLNGPNYEYDFRDGRTVELPRTLFESPRFASIRDRLEIVEHPVMVRDPKTEARSTKPAKE